jgi:hypothetical protein
MAVTGRISARGQEQGGSDGFSVVTPRHAGGTLQAQLAMPREAA